MLDATPLSIVIGTSADRMAIGSKWRSRAVRVGRVTIYGDTLIKHFVAQAICRSAFHRFFTFGGVLAEKTASFICTALVHVAKHIGEQLYRGCGFHDYRVLARLHFLGFP